jgi:hypothetical protein
VPTAFMCGAMMCRRQGGIFDGDRPMRRLTEISAIISSLRSNGDYDFGRSNNPGYTLVRLLAAAWFDQLVSAGGKVGDTSIPTAFAVTESIFQPGLCQCR